MNGTSKELCLMAGFVGNDVEALGSTTTVYITGKRSVFFLTMLSGVPCYHGSTCLQLVDAGDSRR